MRIRMVDVVGSTILSGALSGEQTMRELLSLTRKSGADAEIVYLDFAGVEVATASYLRESVVAFRDHVRARRMAIYPVLANINEVIEDELRHMASYLSGPLITCSLDDDGSPTDPSVLGTLDPKQQLAFDHVSELGETDAGELHSRFGEAEGVKQTAWNNRLSSLSDLGFLIETSHGRSKRYRPLFQKGVAYGR